MEPEHVKALFYIEPKEAHNRVQNIGCRLLLTEKLIHAGFKKAGVFNLPDGRVEVVLEGEKKDIEHFHDDVSAHIVEWLEERAKDKEKLKKLIGNPGIVISGIDYKPGLMILDIGLYSHSLEMSQLQKGVDVYYDLVAAIQEQISVSKELRGDFKEQAAVYKEQAVISKHLSSVLEKIDKKL